MPFRWQLQSQLLRLPNLVLQACETGTGNCSTSERYPGLWEFPMVRGAGVCVNHFVARCCNRRWRCC